RRDQAEEGQAHDDGDHAADPLQQFPVDVEGLDDAEDGGGGQHEDHGESGDEQSGGAGDPQLGRTTAGGGGGTGAGGLVGGHRRGLRADQPGQIGQVAGYKRN